MGALSPPVPRFATAPRSGTTGAARSRASPRPGHERRRRPLHSALPRLPAVHRHVNYRRRKRDHQHEEAHADEAFGDASGALDHPDVPPGAPEWLADRASLEEFLAHAREESLLAYDTEFIGEETYHPRICLVQLATRRRIALIDPFELDDLEPVWTALCDPDLPVVVHAGGVDLEHATRALEQPAASVVDTQIAAAFAGMPWPVGLGRAIESFTGHKLRKGHTFTNWDARPLSGSQVRYACDDVRYLPLLWDRLRESLEKRGTLEWALGACRERLAVSPDFDPDPQVRRAMKGMSLKPKAVALLRDLVLLRDSIAERDDKPHRVVLPDPALLELSRRRPATRTDLEKIRGMPRPTSGRYGTEIMQVIEDAADKPIARGEGVRRFKESADDQVRIDALWTVVCARLLGLGIAPGVVLSRADLGRWMLERSNESFFDADDWRQETIGAWTEAFVRGDESLRMSWSTEGPVVVEESATS